MSEKRGAATVTAKTEILRDGTVQEQLAQLYLMDRQFGSLLRRMNAKIRYVCERFEPPDLPALARLLPRLQNVRGLGTWTWHRLWMALERVVELRVAEPHVCQAIDAALAPIRELHATDAGAAPESGEDVAQTKSVYEPPDLDAARRARRRAADEIAAEVQGDLGRRRRRKERRERRPSTPGSLPAARAAQRAQLTALLAAELSAKRIADAPLEALEEHLSPKLIRSIQKKLGRQTLGSIAHLIPQLETGAVKVFGLGPQSLRQLNEALLRAAEKGVPPPKTVRELVAAVRAVVETQRYRFLREINDRQVTARALATKYRRTPARLGQILDNRRARLSLRFGGLARKIMDPVVEHLSTSGGLVHHGDLDAWGDGVPIEWWPLPLELAGCHRVVITWDEFLAATGRRRRGIHAPPIMRLLRREGENGRVPIDIVRRIVEEKAGWKLSELGARRYVERVVGLAIDDEGQIRLGKKSSRASRARPRA